MSQVHTLSLKIRQNLTSRPIVAQSSCEGRDIPVCRVSFFIFRGEAFLLNVDWWSADMAIEVWRFRSHNIKISLLENRTERAKLSTQRENSIVRSDRAVNRNL